MLISLGVYALLSAIVFIFAEPLLKLMATDTSIIEASAFYIRIESIANIFSILKFERMLEKRLAIYPDVMDIKRIVSIIGYTDRTIRWHIGKGRIFAIIQDRKYLVSKYSLIKFLASDKGFAMRAKSEWHEKAIKWFVKEMNK